MDLDIETPPENLDFLKQQLASFGKKEQRLEKENELLREQIRLLNAQLYGRKSEKHTQNPDGIIQQYLFDMSPPEEITDEPPVEETKIEAHTRKKRGRKPLPDHLHRIEQIHDVSDEEKICGCGCQKVCIGSEKAEQLDIIPAEIRVVVHTRPKYACKNCDGVKDDGPTVVISPPPPQMIPKSIATSTLLAYTCTNKFVDFLPFFRQEKIFKRLGVDIPRATMCSWAMKSAEGCRPLVNLLLDNIRSGPLIGIDETPTLVMKEKGRSNTKKSYMWVYRGGPLEKPTIIYEYHPTRGSDVAADFLRGYKGYVQSDGYSGYNFLDYWSDIIHIGCWAHSRRKFMDVLKARKIRKGKGKKTNGKADYALRFIRVLYLIERRTKKEELTSAQVHILHQEHSSQVLAEFKDWLDKNVHTIPPKSLLGKAFNYTLNQWHRLVGYIEQPFLTPDNNKTENAIRPHAVGRKNWMFSGAPKGAEATAIFFTLIETAKANHLEPYRYLKYIFDRIPLAQTVEDYEALLPYNLNASQLLAEI